MEKIADSTSEEWIVDGDLYLIKTVSRYPILWDRKNFDSDQRNEIWLKLSKKLKIKLEWLKKRWSYLREQYVRHLKQLNNVESDKPSKKNYKYFTEMSFLADHIQIRNGSYQDLIIHSAHKPTQIEADDSNNEVVDSICVDFVITENEIEEAYNEDEDLTENLFVELSDEEKDEQLHQHDHYHTNSDMIDSPTTVTINCDDSTLNAPTKLTKSAPKFENNVSPELRVTDQHIPAHDIDTTNENCKGATKATESRCEDVIFGELVTSMLKKMDSPNRKRAKKEILNILLS